MRSSISLSSLSPLSSLWLSLLAAAASACAVSDAAPTPAGPATPAAPAASPAPDTCTPFFQRARSCTDPFLGALVDARAQANVPPGIAAAVASDRAGVIAQARTEWLVDSQDDHIAATCAQLASRSTPTDARDAAACLATTTCDAFAACAQPILARHFDK